MFSADISRFRGSLLAPAWLPLALFGSLLSDMSPGVAFRMSLGHPWDRFSVLFGLLGGLGTPRGSLLECFCFIVDGFWFAIRSLFGPGDLSPG